MEMVALDEIASRIDYGLTAAADPNATGPKFLRITDLQDGRIDWNSVPHADCSHKVAEKYKIAAGDLFFARTGATTGKCYMVSSPPDDAVFASYLIRVRASESADPRYLAQFFTSQRYWSQIQRMAEGAAQPGVNASKLKKLSVPLPPLPEQKRIAKILDAADALRTKRRESLAQLDALLQSTFLEMFGDPVENPKGWDIATLGEVARNEDGRRIPLKKADRDEIEGIYPYYGASGIIDHVDDYIFDGPRLLIGEDGANLLARSTPVAFIADGKYWVNNHAHVLAFNGAASLTYLRDLVNLIDLKSYITGTAQPKLNQKQLNRIQVPTPPMKLQERYYLIVSAIHKQKTGRIKQIEELQDLFSSLQHRAFAGQL